MVPTQQTNLFILGIAEQIIMVISASAGCLQNVNMQVDVFNY